MKIGNNESQPNGLQISVDWFSFTVMDSFTPEKVVEIMGYSLDSFQALPRGLNGYRKQLRHSALPISVQYEGQQEMGIHVDISGSAFLDVLKHYQLRHMVRTPFGTVAYSTDSFDNTVFVDFLREIQLFGHVTRLDLAIDDFGGQFYTLPELSKIFFSNCFVSKFRKWKELVKYQNGAECLGHTIYLGSRTSAIMLRIYDKQLEQNERLLKEGKTPILLPWVRWELELKEERAKSAVDFFMSGKAINEVTLGILSNYIRLIESDNPRKDRCSTQSKWLSFLDGISRIRLYRAHDERTVDDTKNWLNRQVATSLAMVLLADGGDTDFLHGLLDSGRQRLTSRHINMINQKLGVFS